MRGRPTCLRRVACTCARKRSRTCARCARHCRIACESAGYAYPGGQARKARHNFRPDAH